MTDDSDTRRKYGIVGGRRAVEKLRELEDTEDGDE